MLILRSLAIALAILIAQPACTETLNIAVASNFKATLEKLITSQDFKFDHELKISSGSTGSLYAQIINGAPYDIFLAADSHRPVLLEASGLVIPGSRKTYAIGQLALWVPGTSPVNEASLSLFSGNLAIANPQTAPYGLAAQHLIKELNIVEPRIVTGENIAQTYQFVHTGNAQAGLVSLSQIVSQGIDPPSYWLVPQRYHQVIEQQMVMLEASPASADFASYLISRPARNIIAASGYQVPGNPDHD